MAESVGAFLLGGIFIGATIGAALKKIAVAILTNKNALKKALTVILVILLVILMPVIAIISFFSGGISVDTAGLSQKIEAQLTAEERAKISKAEELLKKVESEMKKRNTQTIRSYNQGLSRCCSFRTRYRIRTSSPSLSIVSRRIKQQRVSLAMSTEHSARRSRWKILKN